MNFSPYFKTFDKTFEKVKDLFLKALTHIYDMPLYIHNIQYSKSTIYLIPMGFEPALLIGSFCEENVIHYTRFLFLILHCD